MNNNNKHFLQFEDAHKIHAICADLNLSDNDARLFTYVHAKGIESGLGINYFDNPPEKDREALEIMLGQCKGTLRLPAVTNLDDSSQKALDLIISISNEITKLDNLLAREYGMENRLSGELRGRLRLYRDSSFRNKIISLYNERIAPLLAIYDKDRIEKAFTRYRSEQQRIEQELIDITGMGST